ncbi:hypothetical protein BSPWISOXPB_10360 [uncultured Gammaproteobacteria bacterium]|nr:hypothetical protein BSPWISOXPB_1719 [uncultured Gammaproteobacteria bacterium]VVM20869.1 hypothetical protein BSPWISOXPB_3228 [uncultured Gammaproteobacteria bacterium]VVM27388.1 hypothetical protein BSPWISOXPB_10360 [uncultured Gammaproteobacteria bacterium]
MPKRIQLPDDFYKHDFKQLAKIEKHPRTRIRFIGLSHIQNGKSYEQVAQYLLQSLSAVKQWVRHYKDEGIDGLKEKQRSGRPVRLAIRIIPNYFNLYLQCRIIKMVAESDLKIFKTC